MAIPAAIALAELERVESALAELYAWLAEVLAADAAAAGLFLRLSGEERGHRSLVSLQRRIAVASPEEFGDVEFDPASVGELLSRVEAFRAESRTPDVERAVRAAIAFESNAAERLHATLVPKADSPFHELLETLVGADLAHTRELESFRLRRAAR
jgi:rubrerythrin